MSLHPLRPRAVGIMAVLATLVATWAALFALAYLALTIVLRTVAHG